MQTALPRASILDEIDMRLFIPLVVHTVLLHTGLLMARVVTTYRALELDISLVWIGIIAASFSLLPAILAVPCGRVIDRGHDALAIWIGSGLSLVACAGFVLIPANEITLACNTALLGIGQLGCMAGHQMLSVRAAKGPRGRDAIFGYHMVAIAAGQGLGPFIVAWLSGSAHIPPTLLIFNLALAMSCVCFASAFFMTRAPAAAMDERRHAAMGLGELVPAECLARSF